MRSQPPKSQYPESKARCCGSWCIFYGGDCSYLAALLLHRAWLVLLGLGPKARIRTTKKAKSGEAVSTVGRSK